MNHLPLHKEEWTKMSEVGRSSSLDRLARVIEERMGGLSRVVPTVYGGRKTPGDLRHVEECGRGGS